MNCMNVAKISYIYCRWSNKLPVPGLGDEDSTFEDVDEFYKFWCVYICINNNNNNKNI